MNGKRKHLMALIVLASVLLVGLVMANGCKKEEPAASTDLEGAVGVVIEQKTCPVMGGAIDTKYFTEYQGKKVYFCCPGCKEKFEQEPEKYIAKLPQFSK